MVTPVVTVFRQSLSRSAAAAIELLVDGFAGTVVSDRFSAHNNLPLEQRQLCWAHLERVLPAIVERTGASAEFAAQLLQLQQHRKQALWSFLEHPGIEPTNNAAERALRPAVIQRKITGLPSNSRGVQSAKGALCRSRLLTVTTTLRQQGRDVWDFLDQAWIAHPRGG